MRSIWKRLSRWRSSPDQPSVQAAGDQQAVPAVGHLETYSSLVPDRANAVGLFDGYWSTLLPDIPGGGTFTGFSDARVAWLIENVPVAGRKVLELGPLEGGHSFLLERAGAEVTAIEGNHAAFLRCLIVKNIYQLRAQFLLGDFARSFGPPVPYDMVVASGVLYHMTDPVDLLRRMAAAADTLFLWTHCFDPDPAVWNAALQPLVGKKWRTDLTETVMHDGLPVRLVPQIYGEALGWKGFCGGPETISKWIYRDDLIRLLERLGFASIEIAFDHRDHPNGPSFCVLARKHPPAATGV